MRILVVHEVSYEKKPVYEYQDFAERLAARGHQVTVVDFDDGGEGLGGTKELSRTGLAKVRLENTPFTNLPILKYLTGRRNYRKRLKQLLEVREIDVVFLYSVFINGTQTVELCRQFGIPVVYRILDVYHKLRESLLIMTPLYFGEKYIYRNADVVCLTNEKMAGYVEKMCEPSKPRSLATVHHGVDLDFFRVRPRDMEFVERYGIEPDEKIVLFVGTTYSFSGLDKILERWDRVEKAIPRLRFFIVGGGDLDSKITALIEERGLTGRVVFTGFRPYNEVPRYLSLADLTLLPFEINDITRDIIPIKVLQYLAGRKALLSAPIPDVMRLFPSGESGVVYQDIGDPDAYVENIIHLLRDDARRDALAAAAESFVETNFSIDAQMSKLEQLLAGARAEPS